MTTPKDCPTCGSPLPHLHPVARSKATNFSATESANVKICTDKFHLSEGAPVVRSSFAKALALENSELQAKLKSIKTELEQAQNEVQRLERLVYVPGLLKCAKCKFTLISSTLNAATGLVKANNEPEQCANGCGPMWRVTERDAGNDLIDRMDAAFDNGLERAAQTCEQRKIENWTTDEVRQECADAIRGLKSTKRAGEPG